jgi:hypothetical protein
MPTPGGANFFVGDHAGAVALSYNAFNKSLTSTILFAAASAFDSVIYTGGRDERQTDRQTRASLKPMAHAEARAFTCELCDLHSLLSQQGMCGRGGAA